MAVILLLTDSKSRDVSEYYAQMTRPRNEPSGAGMTVAGSSWYSAPRLHEITNSMWRDTL